MTYFVFLLSSSLGSIFSHFWSFFIIFLFRFVSFYHHFPFFLFSLLNVFMRAFDNVIWRNLLIIYICPDRYLLLITEFLLSVLGVFSSFSFFPEKSNHEGLLWQSSKNYFSQIYLSRSKFAPRYGVFILSYGSFASFSFFFKGGVDISTPKNDLLVAVSLSTLPPHPQKFTKPPPPQKNKMRVVYGLLC